MRYKKRIIAILLIIFSLTLFAGAAEQLNVLIIGAHPDDAEQAGGLAALYVNNGHKVKLVSMTNGDAGHYDMSKDSLAQRRRKEAHKAGEVIGAEYVVLDNHDGHLMPTYQNRKEVIKLIREFKSDIVITHRPYDYHPDHRYTGELVRDAAYMVTVPKIVPGVPHLKTNPLFLYMSDEFTHPESFEPDVTISIDKVIEEKIEMYHAHKSQMYEWLPYNKGILSQVPETEEKRRKWLANWRKKYPSQIADKFRYQLEKYYGKKAAEINYAEAYQDSEYGTSLTEDNLQHYFPFLPE